MFKGLGDLTNLLKSAKQIQEQMATLQEQLGDQRFEATSGEGLVRAVVDGRGTLLEIHIDPQAVHDIAKLEDSIKTAMTTAIGESQEVMKKEMSALTGGIDLSGLSGMLNGGS